MMRRRMRRHDGLIAVLFLCAMAGCTRYGDVVPWPTDRPFYRDFVPVAKLDRDVPVVYPREGPPLLDDTQYAALIDHARRQAPDGREPWYLWVGTQFTSPDGARGALVTLYYKPDVRAPRLRRGWLVSLHLIGDKIDAGPAELREYGQVPPPGQQFDDAPSWVDLMLWPFLVFGPATDDQVIEVADVVRTVMAGEQRLGDRPIRVVVSSQPSPPRALADRLAQAVAPLPISTIEWNDDGSVKVQTGIHWPPRGGRGQWLEYVRRRDMFLICKVGFWMS